MQTLDLKRKYEFYEESVQNPKGEVETLQEVFEGIRGKKALTLREDFCGTGAVLCEWTKQGESYKSFGIDLDPEPVEYGQETHFKKLTDSQKERAKYILGDVFETKTPDCDLIIALNFSYYIFKERKKLLAYFKNVYENLSQDGVFVVDLFGGPESIMPLEEETEHDDFSYYWDCDYFNPIKNECRYFIHFKPKNEKKYKRVFEYDWRMWSFPELREILAEAGFEKTIAYWEGDDEDDEGGNGEFIATEEIDNCEAWVGYIAAIK